MANKLQAIIGNLETKRRNKLFRANKIDHLFDPFIDQTIAMHVLYENGGVLLKDSLTLVGDLSWLDTVSEGLLAMREHPELGTEVVGFYNPGTDHHPFTVNSSHPLLTPYQVLFRKVLMETDFVAAKPHAEFIQEVCRRMLACLVYPQEEIRKLTVDMKFS